MIDLDWAGPVMVFVPIISWIIGYNMGWGAGKDSVETQNWERGYRRCLFIWHKEIMDWRDRRFENQLLSSEDKAYHDDIITIQHEYLKRGKDNGD